MVHRELELWKGIRTFSDGGPTPVLRTYVLDGDRIRPGVLVCPGGGYRILSPREAEPIALAYAAAGFHAFVVEYSVFPRRHPQPILDVARALCILRERSVEWKLSQVAICGFSAGGHAAANLGVHWNHPDIFGGPGIERPRCRPDALILSYPVISSGEHAHRGSFANLLGDAPQPGLLRSMSLELQVSAETPPSFLWHTVSDSAVPVENSLLFAQALRGAGVPFEMHLFPDGRHGIALATTETATPDLSPLPEVAVWHGLSVAWLRKLFSFPR